MLQARQLCGSQCDSSRAPALELPALALRGGMFKERFRAFRVTRDQWISCQTSLEPLQYLADSISGVGGYERVANATASLLRIHQASLRQDTEVA